MGKAFCQLNVGFCTPQHQTPAMSRKPRSAGFCDWSRCRTALLNHRQSESIGLMRFQKHRQSVSFSDTALAFAFARELVESGEYQNISAAVSVEMDRTRAARDRERVLCKTPVQQRLALPLDAWEPIGAPDSFTKDARSHLARHAQLGGGTAGWCISSATLWPSETCWHWSPISSRQRKVTLPQHPSVSMKSMPFWPILLPTGTLG